MDFRGKKRKNRESMKKKPEQQKKGKVRKNGINE